MSEKLMPKKHILILPLVFIATLLLCGTVAAAYSEVEILPPTYAIKDLTLSPQTLMPKDTATLTFTFENTGTQPLIINNVIVHEKEGNIESESDLTSLGAVGAGKSMLVTIPLTAGNKEGIFYPFIYMDFDMDAQTSGHYTYLKYPFNVVVDAKTLAFSVTQRPEAFKPGTAEKLGFSIGNLRTNAVDAVQLTVSGDGVSCEEGSVYLGALQAGETKQAFLTVITSETTPEIHLEAKYRNGANWHTECLTIPLTGGDLRTGAELVVNNIVVTNTGEYVRVTGDVNNAGLTSAKGVVATVEGVDTVQPYPSYVVGSLDTDGLSEFEVTFHPPAINEPVTLVLTYKDMYGNTYMQKEKISLPIENTAVSAQSSAPFSKNNTAATITAVIISVLILLLVIRVWKNSDMRQKKQQ